MCVSAVQGRPCSTLSVNAACSDGPACLVSQATQLTSDTADQCCSVRFYLFDTEHSYSARLMDYPMSPDCEFSPPSLETLQCSPDCRCSPPSQESSALQHHYHRTTTYHWWHTVRPPVYTIVTSSFRYVNADISYNYVYADVSYNHVYADVTYLYIYLCLDTYLYTYLDTYLYICLYNYIITSTSIWDPAIVLVSFRPKSSCNNS